MSVIALEKASLEMLERRLKQYFVKELDYELGQFQAQFLLDFISQEMGAYFYNQGVRDAQANNASIPSRLPETVPLIPSLASNKVPRTWLRSIT